MPNCFQLFKQSNPTEAVVFAKIDEELCKHFNEPCHAEHWFRDWYNGIGFGLALGQDWNKLRETYDGTNLIPVIDYLEANYTANAWYERKVHG